MRLSAETKLIIRNHCTDIWSPGALSLVYNYKLLKRPSLVLPTANPTAWERPWKRSWSNSVLTFDRPLALRGRVTNALFKQWLGILLMPKIVKAHKNYLTPEIWEETHLRETVYGTLIFQESSMNSIGRHVGGDPFFFGGNPTWRPKLLFACILLKFDSYTQMCRKR